MVPFVALTTTIDPEGGSYRKPMIALYANYASALERVGLSCVLVTPAHSKRSVRRLVAAASGLVLPGGEDIEPSRYGEEAMPELGSVNPARDAMEFRALHAALGCRMPVLGLCRGHQLINVYFGGTLYQDIATQIPGEISHFQTEWGQHHHDAVLEPNTLLARVLGEWRLGINSFHHQAVKDLAPGLRVSAVAADDGMVEGLEHPDYPWVVGVQWHPERHEATAPSSDPNLRIFQAFADAVHDFRIRRRRRRMRIREERRRRPREGAPRPVPSPYGPMRPAPPPRHPG